MTVIKKTLITLIVLIVANIGYSIDERVHINRGTFYTNDGSSFMSLAFNETPTFSRTNHVIEASSNQIINITFINTDSIDHNIEVKGISSTGIILPGDSITVQYDFSDEGIYTYRGIQNYPENTYLGLAGMIVIADNNSPKFFWNIKEHQKSINDSIQSNSSYNFTSYYPDYFTLNGNSAPEINNDPSARITGSVGETLYVYIFNTGQSIHSLHFHGYHLEIIQSSKFSSHTGRSKDTFAIYPQEGMILKLVPDKPGEFPVHDHNLIAVSGGGIYPIGRFLTMLIQ